MVVIIGSGVTGCFTGEHLAHEYDVQVFERKDNLHKTCSGIVTNRLNEVLELKKSLIQDKIYDVKVYAPNKTSIDIHFKKPDIVLYREAFSAWLKDRAQKKGCTFYEQHLFEKMDGNTAIIKDLKTGKRLEIKNNYIIGADGAFSRVAKETGMYGKRKFFTAIKVEAKAKHDNSIKFYPFIKDFAWVSPINKEEVEIGIAAQKNPAEVFDRFLKIISKEMKLKVIKKESALIPLYNPLQIMQKRNVFLTGDAATINKPTSGGGIVFGLKSSKILADFLIAKKHGKALYQNYNWLIKSKLGNELWLHSVMRNIMSNFKDEDWNRFIAYTKKEEIVQLLRDYSRDYAIKIGLKTLIAQPKFLYFLKYLKDVVREN
ncbi:NAD(P)/FAD-dependent oxidoreductase [Candidatus Woesearchaeota archaeon]|nr:MAG: NAD(P)/FAD-dependent oxidoreductase [Candidatus Woesearchaeota archaeon]